MSTTTSALREKLHHYIDHVEDKKIKAFYTIVESDIKNEETIYTPAFKAILDQRQEDYKNGKEILITAAESKKRIQKLIKQKFKK